MRLAGASRSRGKNAGPPGDDAGVDRLIDAERRLSEALEQARAEARTLIDAARQAATAAERARGAEVEASARGLRRAWQEQLDASLEAIAAEARRRVAALDALDDARVAELAGAIIATVAEERFDDPEDD